MVSQQEAVPVSLRDQIDMTSSESRLSMVAYVQLADSEVDASAPAVLHLLK